VLHQSAGQEDMFPIEVDLDLVRRQRETGIRGLGQVLKSFRDRAADFSVYDRASGTDAYLHTLGPLETPRQGSARGLRSADPRTALGHVEHPDIPVRNVSIFHGKTGSD
jgi:hypothetical protein